MFKFTAGFRVAIYCLFLFILMISDLDFTREKNIFFLFFIAMILLIFEIQTYLNKE